MHLRLPELKEIIDRRKLDIILINETKLTDRLIIKIKNYTLIRKDRDTIGGGVAILIKNNIPHKIVEHQINTNIENICLKLEDSTIIIAAYNPPRNFFSERELEQFSALGDRVLIIGDLNSRHTTWNNHTNGRTLHSHINNSNSIVNFPNSKTHFPSNNMTPTCVDIIINKNTNYLGGPNALHELSSDHLPIYFELNIRRPNHTETTTKVLTTLKTVNWKLFRKTLDGHITVRELF